MKCRFTTTETADLYRCKRCGREVRTKHEPDKIHATCKAQPRFPLGTWLARFLRLFGITPKRVEKLTGKPCGCKKREQQLNNLLGVKDNG